MNEILRRALLAAHLNEVDVAACLDVDPKTVRRWLEGRLPYTRHRWALADLLNVSETDLWPDLRSRPSRPDELVAVFPHRYSIPQDTWHQLFISAERKIGILDYDSLFLAEDPDIVNIFTKKARGGIRVRIALGDPSDPHCAAHGELGDNRAVAIAKIRRALSLFQPLRDIPGVEIRLHHVALYNSLYCVDDDLMCNQHAYGVPAESGPVMHLRLGERSDMIRVYANAFDRIWLTAESL